jgi:hypothetical protein
MLSARYSCQIIIKLEFFRQMLEKYSNAKFHKHPSSGNRAIPCGLTDGHDKAFSQDCERAKNEQEISMIANRRTANYCSL